MVDVEVVVDVEVDVVGDVEVDEEADVELALDGEPHPAITTRPVSPRPTNHTVRCHRTRRPPPRTSVTG